MPSLVGFTDAAGITVAANYLVVKQSPGAAYADKDGVVITSAPLLTFNTPNLQMFKVSVAGVNLTATPAASNSAWSKAIRGVQVTSEVFGVFAPAVVEGDSTFCFLAPDFNTNAGAASVTGDAQVAIDERGGDFSVVEKAIADALGVLPAAVTVIRCMVVGDTVLDEVAPV
jgi:hypothetical protein